MQEFKLSQPLEIKSTKGEVIESYDTLYLHPPLNKHKIQSMTLRNAFTNAMLDMSKRASGGETQQGGKEELGVEFVAVVLGSATNLDIEKFNNAFDGIVCDTCYLDCDNSKKVSKIDLSLVSIEDYCNLQAQYIHLFFLNWWMKALT